jgi:predicted membrane metal-binding protein
MTMTASEPSIRLRRPAMGSSRGFGIVFAVVFGVVALWPLLAGAPPRLWASVVAGMFLALALIAPRLLSPLNRLWFRFGLALHRVVNPIIMAIIYLTTVVPVGLILRACGKDILRLKRDPNAQSYWIARDPPGPPPGSMTKQF